MSLQGAASSHLCPVAGYMCTEGTNLCGRRIKTEKGVWFQISEYACVWRRLFLSFFLPQVNVSVSSSCHQHGLTERCGCWLLKWQQSLHQRSHLGNSKKELDVKTNSMTEHLFSLSVFASLGKTLEIRTTAMMQNYGSDEVRDAEAETCNLPFLFFQRCKNKI